MVDQRANLAGEMPPMRIDGLQAGALGHPVLEHANQPSFGDQRVSEVGRQYGEPKAGKRRLIARYANLELL